MLDKITEILESKRVDDIYIQSDDGRINLNFDLFSDSVCNISTDKKTFHVSSRFNALTIKENKIIRVSFQNNLLFIIVKGL